MNREFDNVLDECLERLLVKGETVEECLHSFPGHADELKPLLETALAASQASAIQPRPEFRERARHQLHTAFLEMERRKSRSFFDWAWQPRWATAVVSIVLVLLLSGGGTAAAASGSMPDDTLYPVKLVTEQARLALTFSEIGKAEFNAELADLRVNEIIYLANENKPEIIEQTTDRLNKHLLVVATLSVPEGVQSETVILEAVEEAPATGEDMEMDEFPAPGSITATEETPESEETLSAAKVPAIKETQKQKKTLAPDRITAQREGRAVEEAPAATEQFPTGAGANLTANRQISLKITVMNRANSNSARLRTALQKAPESSKPALEKAINSVEENYKKILDSLDK